MPNKKPSRKVKPVQNDRVMLQHLAIYLDMATAGVYLSAMPAKIAEMSEAQNPTGWKPTIDEIYAMSKRVKDIPKLRDMGDDHYRAWIDLCCEMIYAKSMQGGDYKNALGALGLIANTHQLGRPEKKKADEEKPLDMKALRAHYRREVGEK